MDAYVKLQSEISILLEKIQSPSSASKVSCDEEI